MSEPNVVLPTPSYSGKVRDLYEVADDDHGGRLLMVASDRMSAFDVVLPTPIPDKGKILTQLSLWWFEQLATMIDNHVITADVDAYPAPFTGRPDLAGRSMLVRRLDMVMVECVARAYLSGQWHGAVRSVAVGVRGAAARWTDRGVATARDDLHADDQGRSDQPRRADDVRADGGRGRRRPCGRVARH